ncbi:MAG: prepilin-type N-terminal cleavage/methylation domain-containing protein [Symbiopectobacterium sp.]
MNNGSNGKYLAYQQIAIYAAGLGGETLTLLERGLSPRWQLDLTEQFQTEACLRVSSTVTTPQHYQARLYRSGALVPLVLFY